MVAQFGVTSLPPVTLTPYIDSDDSDTDYGAAPRIEYANQDDDSVWQNMQVAKFQLKPLERKDMDALAEHAAYTLTGEWR
jgi:hypothetical protein